MKVKYGRTASKQEKEFLDFSSGGCERLCGLQASVCSWESIERCLIDGIKGILRLEEAERGEETRSRRGSSVQTLEGDGHSSGEGSEGDWISLLSICMMWRLVAIIPRT